MFGRVIDGVGGTARRGGLLFATVTIVKPRLLSFLRGGVGGFTNAGETGEETLSLAVAMVGCDASGAEVTARLNE